MSVNLPFWSPANSGGILGGLAPAFNGIAMWVTSANGTGYVLRSIDDGKTFQQFALPRAGDWVRVAFFKGRYFLFEGGNAASSAYLVSVDGINWVEHALPGTAGLWTCIRAFPSILMLMQNGGTFGAYTLDGVVFNAMVIAGSQTWRGAEYDGQKYWALAQSGVTQNSVDGINWNLTGVQASTGSFFDPVYRRGRWVVTSTVGDIWQGPTLDTMQQVVFGAPGQYQFMSYDEIGTFFYAAEWGNAFASYSEDGINWKPAPTYATLPGAHSWRATMKQSRPQRYIAFAQDAAGVVEQANISALSGSTIPVANFTKLIKAS